MKGNLFLGFARGKVGDVVFWRQNGEQVARARNRSPRNPQTAYQLLQRVLMKTTAQAYSALQDITNHSFQGFAEGTESQGRFVKLNIDYFRNLLSQEINSGDPQDIWDCNETNFAARYASAIEINPYIVSEGKLPKFNAAWDNSSFLTGLAYPDTPMLSYASFIEANGLQQGDQLTFLGLGVDDTQETGTFNSFKYARIILEPASGNMSDVFLQSESAYSAVYGPNSRNQGVVKFLPDDGALRVQIGGLDNTTGKANSICAAAVIVSRLVGDSWARSDAKLAIRDWSDTVTGHLTENHNVDLLGDALYSYVDVPSSSLYLNQSE